MFHQGQTDTRLVWCARTGGDHNLIWCAAFDFIDGDFVEVLSGLSAGDAYVSKNSFVIKADIGKADASHEH